MLTGSISGSWTFGMGFDCSLELVVDVGYKGVAECGK